MSNLLKAFATGRQGEIEALGQFAVSNYANLGAPAGQQPPMQQPQPNPVMIQPTAPPTRQPVINNGPMDTSPSWLVTNESGGNWRAENDCG